MKKICILFTANEGVNALGLPTPLNNRRDMEIRNSGMENTVNSISFTRNYFSTTV